jgi:hypothetical protein
VAEDHIDPLLRTKLRQLADADPEAAEVKSDGL